MKKIKLAIRKVFGGRIAHCWRTIIDYRALKKALSVTYREQMQFPTKVAILFIGTNKYIHFFPRYYTTFKKFFLPKTKKDFFVFTDQTNFEFFNGKEDVIIVPIKHEKFPFVNLRKFKFINKAKKKLKNYSHIIYIDADMYAVSVISEKEFFCHDKPLFAVQHFNFVNKISPEQFEQNPKSLASVKEGDDLSTYWQACFWGGKSKDFLKATEKLEKDTEIDIKNGIIAKWWDESFLNKYLIDNKKDVYTVDPSYSWTQAKPMPFGFKKRIIHVDENPPGFSGRNLKVEIRKRGHKLK